METTTVAAFLFAVLVAAGCFQDAPLCTDLRRAFAERREVLFRRGENVPGACREECIKRSGAHRVFYSCCSDGSKAIVSGGADHNGTKVVNAKTHPVECFLPRPLPPTIQPTTDAPDETCSAREGTSCFFGFCPGGYDTGSTCVGGYCRCLNNSNRDPCTCLAIVGSCHITRDADNAVGTPTFVGKPQTTYSCVASDNPNYDVHVISNYQGNGHTAFRVHNTGNTSVHLSVSGNSSKPLILIFISYEAVNWILDIPREVTIGRAILRSNYLDDSDVTYDAGKVLAVERSRDRKLRIGYGLDTGGEDTLQLLQTLYNRFGPIASFSGSHSADSWRLSIDRNVEPPGTTEVPTTTTQPPTMATFPTTNEPSCLASEKTMCRGGICLGFIHTGATCVEGYCICLDNPNRDPCTCLAIVGSCHITIDADNAVGTPTFEGKSQTTYSCVSSDNLNYDVHVISNYGGNGVYSDLQVYSTGNTSVHISVSGTSSKPLVVILISYEPVNWILDIPREVTIDTAILASYYLEESDITYDPGRVLAVERSSDQTLIFGYRSGMAGDDTQLLQTLHNRFGPIASFSSAYKADSWRLEIRRDATTGPPTAPPTRNP